MRLGPIAAAMILGTLAVRGQEKPPRLRFDPLPEVVLFDGSSFELWEVTDLLRRSVRDSTPAGAFPGIHDGAMQLTRSAGWMHTRDVYDNFKLTLEYRTSPKAYAGVFVRTWRSIDRVGAPSNGYQVVLGEGPRSRLPGFVVGHGRKGTIAHFDENRSRAVAHDTGRWHRLTVMGITDRIDVSVDGELITIATNLENPAGYIGLRGEAGSVDVRHVAVTSFIGFRRDAGIPTSCFDDTRFTTRPTVAHHVKPQYTRAAMDAQIEGAVLLKIVVSEDGAVTDVRIMRSADNKYGLDDEAIKAARQWRFQPARIGDTPTACSATIELTFTLRQ